MAKKFVSYDEFWMVMTLLRLAHSWCMCFMWFFLRNVFFVVPVAILFVFYCTTC